MYDSLKILGLGLGASEREVKLAYCHLACIYHPDNFGVMPRGIHLVKHTGSIQIGFIKMIILFK
jgi:preprotein translocase subunit Sec63